MQETLTTIVQILCLERQKLTTEYKILKIDQKIKEKSITSSHNDNNTLIEKNRIAEITSDLKTKKIELEDYLTTLEVKLSKIDKYVIDNIE